MTIMMKKDELIAGLVQRQQPWDDMTTPGQNTSWIAVQWGPATVLNVYT